MTKLNQIYKCNVCGNIVEILHAGKGKLVCCEKPMELLQAKTKDEGNEKHVPVIEETESGIKVKVGSTPHPMEAKHYIEFIEVLANDAVHRKFLKPGDKPEAEFNVKSKKAREFCNVHGLWSN
jgi:superoxide reductase